MLILEFVDFQKIFISLTALPKTKEQGIQCQLDRYLPFTRHEQGQLLKGNNETYGEMDTEDDIPEPIDPDWTSTEEVDYSEDMTDSKSNEWYFFFLIKNITRQGNVSSQKM